MISKRKKRPKKCRILRKPNKKKEMSYRRKAYQAVFCSAMFLSLLENN